MFEKLTQESFDNMLLCKDDYNSIEDYSIDTELVFPEWIEGIEFNHCAFNKPIKNVEFYNVTFRNVDISKFSNCVFRTCKFDRCVFDCLLGFYDCDIKYSSFELCKLYGVMFDGCTLYSTFFWCSDLRGAYFKNTNGDKVSFQSCEMDNCRSFNSNLVFPQHVPSEGSFIAWKKARIRKLVENDYEDTDVIVKLRVVEDADRCSANHKCRASKVEVIQFETLDGEKLPDDSDVRSFWNSLFKYHIGIVESHGYNTNPQDECSNGIHFFLNRNDAVNYVF